MINMLNGSISITTDKEFVKQQTLSGFKVVIIGDRDEELLQYYGALMGECLIPNYNAMSAYVDDDIQNFINIYVQQLSSYEVEEFITVVMYSICEGNNILLYLTPQEAQLPYSAVLMDFINKYYGVLIGTPNNPYIFNEAFYGIILDKLFIHSLIDEYTYLQSYPLQMPIINDTCIYKLVNIFKPYIMDQSINGYKAYFNEYKNNLHQSNGVFLQDPFRRG